jgi:hypothetical protein
VARRLTDCGIPRTRPCTDHRLDRRSSGATLVASMTGRDFRHGSTRGHEMPEPPPDPREDRDDHTTRDAIVIILLFGIATISLLVILAPQASQILSTVSGSV